MLCQICQTSRSHVLWRDALLLADSREHCVLTAGKALGQSDRRMALVLLGSKVLSLLWDSGLFAQFAPRSAMGWVQGQQ